MLAQYSSGGGEAVGVLLALGFWGLMAWAGGWLWNEKRGTWGPGIAWGLLLGIFGVIVCAVVPSKKPHVNLSEPKPPVDAS